MFRRSYLDSMIAMSHFMAIHSISRIKDDWAYVPFLAGGGIFTPPVRPTGYVLKIEDRLLVVSNVVVGALATIHTLRKFRLLDNSDQLRRHERNAVSFFFNHIAQLEKFGYRADAQNAQDAIAWLDHLTGPRVDFPSATMS